MSRFSRIASSLSLWVGLLASTLPLVLWWTGDAPPFLGRWSWVLGLVGLGIALQPHAAQRRAAGTRRGVRVWFVLGVLCLALYLFALEGLTAVPPGERTGPRVQIGFGMSSWSLTRPAQEIAATEDLHTPQELLLSIAAFHEDGGSASELWKPWSLVTAGLLPPAIRDAYGLCWNERRASVLRLVAAASRRLLPWLPSWLRYSRVARIAAPGAGAADAETIPTRR